MFESIVSKVINVVRTATRAIGAATGMSPWLAPVAVLVLFLIW
jgi:hypothetical protein